MGFLGIRHDGTLWQQSAKTGLRQLDAGTNWIEASAGAMIYALKNDGTLWTWGANQTARTLKTRSSAKSQSTSVPTNDLPVIRQFGTDTNWIAVRAGNGAMGIKSDGTLWAWDHIMLFAADNTFGANWTALAEPVQMCKETNWVSFEPHWFTRVRNRDGELWGPFVGRPNPEITIAAISNLAITNAIPGKFGFCLYDGTMLHCEIRADGTLWQRTFNDPAFRVPNQKNGPCQQVGKRTDWVQLSSGYGIIYGLTADGTLWTWGLDPIIKTEPSFSRKIRLMTERIKEWSSRRSTGVMSSSSSLIPLTTKEPHPLLRLKEDAGAN